MTKAKFLTTYREYIIANYPWTADVAKLDRFMASVEQTLTTDRIPWAWKSESTKAVWKAIGCKGPMTLKALRALPETEIERPVPKHEVIPCRYYEDPRGVRYSPFTSWKPADAVLVTKGWTIRWDDGTEGTAQKAFETEAEAQAYLAKMPKYFRGMSTMGN